MAVRIKPRLVTLAPAQQNAAAGRALRRRNDALREVHAPPGQLVQVRRLYVRVPRGAQRLEVVIVGDDEYDVWPAGLSTK